MFGALTEAESLALMSMLRHGYNRSREAARWLRGAMRAYGIPCTPETRKLLSARTGSLYGVRRDLTWISSDLLDHFRELERQ